MEPTRLSLLLIFAVFVTFVSVSWLQVENPHQEFSITPMKRAVASKLIKE